MLIIEFETKHYTVTDQDNEFYICAPASQHDGYHYITKSKAKVIADTEEFYNSFEDCWDYAFQTYTTTTMYKAFCKKAHLIEDVRPTHLDMLPYDAQKVFKSFILGWMVANDMFDLSNVVFNDETAAIDYYESQHREDISDVAT